jgi:TPR repeat protein
MRVKSRASLSRLIGVTAALSMAPVAHADLYAATAAYEKKDHARAFELFRELAELGHPLAQETVAIMYVLGEGVKRDNVAGYAWAQISQESAPSAKVQPIIDQLEHSLTPEARVRVAELQARFGKRALEKHLLPMLRAPGASDSADPAHPVCDLTRPGNASLYYPKDAVRAAASGSVLIEATVLADGRARNPRAVLSLPPNAFDAAGRHVAFDSGYKISNSGAADAGCSVSFWVRFKISTSKNERLLEEEITKLKEGVAARDPTAQLQYALLNTGWPNLNREARNMAPLFIGAAQAGLPTAQFSVGLISIKGWGVVRDRAKGIRWLEIAANAGHHDARVLLATEILRSKPDAGGITRARDLLEKAVAGGNFNAQYFLADLLLGDTASTIPADPRRSLELLGAVMSAVENDPAAFEIRAAAMSQTGDFAGAVAAQQRAVSRARKMKWDVAPQEARLARYLQNEAWTQRLLVY